MKSCRLLVLLAFVGIVFGCILAACTADRKVSHNKAVFAKYDTVHLIFDSIKSLEITIYGTFIVYNDLNQGYDNELLELTQAMSNRIGAAYNAHAKLKLAAIYKDKVFVKIIKE